MSPRDFLYIKHKKYRHLGYDLNGQTHGVAHLARADRPGLAPFATLLVARDLIYDSVTDEDESSCFWKRFSAELYSTGASIPDMALYGDTSVETVAVNCCNVVVNSQIAPDDMDRE